MRITGTFIDEISHDIPSNNWNAEKWAKDFQLMRQIGIDTVILIRAGYKNVATFNSKVLKKHINILPVYKDLVDLFLGLSEENKMDFFFGVYDSGVYRAQGDYQKEIDINREFIDEVWQNYGHRKAFRGWYLSHELGRKDLAGQKCIQHIGLHCKEKSPDLPILISPFLLGSKLVDNPITLAEHKLEWDEILASLRGIVDIVAFQDGQVDFHDLAGYLEVNSELIRKYGMKAWSNAESFDRDKPFNFPPIDWRKLWWKLCAAKEVRMEKVITFEFSHFMSPNSSWPAAKNLFDCYCEHFGIKVNASPFGSNMSAPKKRFDIKSIEAYK